MICEALVPTVGSPYDNTVREASRDSDLLKELLPRDSSGSVVGGVESEGRKRGTEAGAASSGHFEASEGRKSGVEHL